MGSASVPCPKSRILRTNSEERGLWASGPVIGMGESSVPRTSSLRRRSASQNPSSTKLWMRWTISSRGKPTAPAPAIPPVFRLPSSLRRHGERHCTLFLFLFFLFYPLVPRKNILWTLLWRAYNSKTFRGVVKDHEDKPVGVSYRTSHRDTNHYCDAKEFDKQISPIEKC